MARAAALSVRHRRFAWFFLVLGAAGPGVLGTTYWFTHEPAPSVRVLWRDEINLDRQLELEREYLLANRRAPHPDAPKSFAYDLLDTRASNIEALVRDPGVQDTNDIDREHFLIRIDRASGEQWMWAAHRTPGLRDARIRWSLILALAGFAVYGCWQIRQPTR